MAIRFVTDSASDITLAEAKELGVRLVPLTVSFGGEEYADGLELSHRGFFEKLIESDVMPTTSQVSRLFGGVHGAYRERRRACGDNPVLQALRHLPERLHRGGGLSRQSPCR